ncbi:hypothetical protein P154DRAFT_576973 [Amniculicola lignicola CBS 123094]|uniref:Uncharacterized protein n=1 Tax=Amniculicola lignicola CBS 123094 TaxID=1392246 RepID=A0A6A5WHD4_9PLEO|nr:hypothetical protein P154DRAFT_576973 [Amniculicola lignicola CBS 123094]
MFYSSNQLNALLCAWQCLASLSSSPLSNWVLVSAQDVAVQGISEIATELAVSSVADFNQTVRIAGQMQKTTQPFKDGLTLDINSPTPRTLTVTKNNVPLDAQFVTGSSGAPFMALSPYSYILKTNDSASNLIAAVSLPYNTSTIKQAGVDPANTYVGKLASDGLSWVVTEMDRSINVAGNATRMVKMTGVDGEYLLLGRRTTEEANVFVEYGYGERSTVAMVGGRGVQEAQWVDGLRISALVDKAMGVNVALRSGVGGMVGDMMSLNSYSWVMNTSMTNQALKQGSVSFPINTNLMSNTTASNFSTLKFAIGRRALNATSNTPFTSIDMGNSNPNPNPGPTSSSKPSPTPRPAASSTLRQTPSSARNSTATRTSVPNGARTLTVTRTSTATLRPNASSARSSTSSRNPAATSTSAPNSNPNSNQNPSPLRVTMFLGPNPAVIVSGMVRLDGEYVILVPRSAVRAKGVEDGSLGASAEEGMEGMDMAGVEEMGMGGKKSAAGRRGEIGVGVGVGVVVCWVVVVVWGC